MISLCIPTRVFGDFVIYSALPNTTQDKNLEYIEIKNTATTMRSLLGYSLQDKSQKSYVIGDVSLGPQENIRFLRPDTRLILNNTNEEIRLLTPQGDIVDEVKYDRSTKGEEIIFFEEMEKEIISDEAILQMFFSDEVDIPLIDIPVVLPEPVLIPQIRWNFQQPSDVLNREEVLDIYYCDPAKDLCRVNFDFRSTFEGLRESDYSCETSFGFISGQENRCNPNTIVFPEGQHEVMISVIPDDDPMTDITSHSFIVKNIPPILDDSLEDILEVVAEEEIISGGGIGNEKDLVDDIGEASEEMEEDDISDDFEEIVIPEISISFQQPSDVLSRESSGDIYYCDSEKDSCRINFDFRGSFVDGLRESDYICESDFGFISGQENRCNPNTIVFPEGEHTLRIAISLEEDPRYFTEKIITIIYDPDIDKQSAVFATEGDTSLDEDIEIIPEITLEDIPEVVVDFQRPSYVELGDEGVYVCDSSRQICRINFDLRGSFVDGLRESDYICRSDFGFATGQENRCNPNTIDIPVGEHRFVFQIFHEDRDDIFQEYEIEVSHPEFVYPENGASSPSFSSSRASSSGNKYIEKIWIKTPRIDIQKGLERDGYDLLCNKDICKVNLKYEKQHKDERCIWDFGPGIYKESTAYRCNPGYVEYTPGRHKITLSVYQKNKRSNARESSLYFSVGKNHDEDIQKSSVLSENVEPTIQNLKIELQGRIGNHKILFEDMLVCRTKNTCSINFDSSMEISGDPKTLSYYWDFGDGTYSDRSNPLSKKFEVGEYRISLKVRDGDRLMEEQLFLVSVVSDTEAIQKTDISRDIRAFTGSIQLSSILVNPVGTDIREWIEIQNIGTNQVYIESCFIRRGTKKYTFPQGVFISSGQKYKVFRTQSTLTFPNNGGTLELICGEKVIDTLSREKIPEGHILYKDGATTYGFYQVDREDFTSFGGYREFVEKSFHMTTRVLKKGIKIRIQTLSNTFFELHNTSGYFRKGVTDENGLFELILSSGVNIGEHIFTVSLSDNLGEDYNFQSDTVSLEQQDINNFWIANTPKKGRKSQQKKETIPELIISSSENIINASTGLSMYSILLYSFLILIGTLMLGFLLVWRHLYIATSLSYYTTVFTIRQRVILLVS